MYCTRLVVMKLIFPLGENNKHETHFINKYISESPNSIDQCEFLISLSASFLLFSGRVGRL